jgi:chemotaxis protein histidine kinase CheA
MNDLESLLAAKIALIRQEFLGRLQDEWLPNLRTLRQRFEDMPSDQEIRTELMRAGHNMSGSGAMFGFTDVSTVGRQLEQRIRGGNSDAVGSDADRREILAILDRLDEVCTAALREASLPTPPQL